MSDTETPSWGIEPVPERLRVLGILDGFLLWANLSVSLLVIVAGAFLVLPASDFGLALSLPEALGAIVAAAVVGNVLLALGGLIGADARVPTMVLMRAPLGRRGSYLPTGLNIAAVPRLVGVRADRDRHRGERALAAGARLRRRRVLEDPVRRRRDDPRVPRPGRVRAPVRPQVRRVDRDRVAPLPRRGGRCTASGPIALWHRHGAHAFWPGFDLVLASIISWTPLVADYTRFSRSRSAGFWGAGLGYFVPTIPLFGLGAVIAMSRHISEAPALLTAIAAGGAASILALLALTVDESDEAFANVYSGAVSLQNLLPACRSACSSAGFAATATVGALAIDLRNYQTFLYLLGSFFVPLFAVLLADWLLAGRHYSADAVFRAPELRPAMLAAWLAGFALYQWLSPARDPSWWTRPRRPRPSACVAVGRRVAPELRRRVRTRPPRPRRRP